MGAARLRRGQRLRNSRDYRRLSRVGRRWASQNFVVLVLPRGTEAGDGARRLGVTVRRRVGGAVVRNRVKRHIREWFRRRREILDPGIDIVVIARASAASLRGSAIDRELTELLAAGRESSRLR